MESKEERNKNHILLEYIADSLNAQDSERYSNYEEHFERISQLLLHLKIPSSSLPILNSYPPEHFLQQYNSTDDSTSIMMTCTRVVLSGSMAKHTSVHHKFDQDIIAYFKCSSSDLFLNKKEIIISTMKDKIKNSIPECHRVQVTPNSLQFSILDHQFDILPGMDMLDDTVGENRVQVQHDKIVEMCHAIMGTPPYIAATKLKVGMTELGDEFIREQSEFVHQLIILCKHWSMVHLDRGLRLHGKSSTIELIATHVGHEFESMDEPDLFTAFEDFLNELSMIDNCSIEFDYPPNKEKFPSILRTQPYILDHVNPYNNRLYQLKRRNPNSRHIVNVIQTRARSSLRILQPNPVMNPFSLNFSTPQAKHQLTIEDIQRIFKLEIYMNKENHSFNDFKQFFDVVQREFDLTSCDFTLTEPDISNPLSSYLIAEEFSGLNL